MKMSTKEGGQDKMPDLFNHMSMYYNFENMTVTYGSCGYRFDNEQKKYVACPHFQHTNSPNKKETQPIGELFFNFLNAEFDTFEGFNNFADKWGLSGFLQITEKTKPQEIALDGLSEKEYIKFINYIYKITRKILVSAQESYKLAVDYCLNSFQARYLKNLTPLQRYRFLAQLSFIQLEDYSTSYYNLNNYDMLIYSKVGVKRIKGELTENDLFELSELIKRDYSIDSKYFRSDYSFKIIPRYYTKNIINFVYIEFFNLLNNFSIARCENCNKYFVPKTRKTEVYCDDCKDIGYINKVRNDIYMTAYRNEYKSRHAALRKITSPKKKILEKSKIDKWREFALTEVKNAKENNTDIEDFKKLLKERE